MVRHQGLVFENGYLGIELDWAGLDWTGLDWTEQGCCKIATVQITRGYAGLYGRSKSSENLERDWTCSVLNDYP